MNIITYEVKASGQEEESWREEGRPATVFI